MNDEKLKEEVRKDCEVLKNGGIILYPTDTIWGIGCDATNELAVKRIYELKHREDNKAMLVLLDDVGKLASYVEVSRKPCFTVSANPLFQRRLISAENLPPSVLRKLVMP